MTNKEIEKKYIYNTDYIVKHKLSDKKIKEAGIELKGLDEIFVQYPLWNDYYISSYGRLISLKFGKVKLLKDSEENGYLGYHLYKVTHGVQRDFKLTAHRMVADVFCPNFWENQKLNRSQLQAHHLDHKKKNNYYKNIILLPSTLHGIMNRVKKIAWFDGKTFREYTPLEIHELTGLTVDEIILSKKGKPEKKLQGKYSVFIVKGYKIGFQFFPKKKREPKKK